jgi:hypothetical protein
MTFTHTIAPARAWRSYDRRVQGCASSRLHVSRHIVRDLSWIDWRRLFALFHGMWGQHHRCAHSQHADSRHDSTLNVLLNSRPAAVGTAVGVSQALVQCTVAASPLTPAGAAAAAGAAFDCAVAAGSMVAATLRS